MPRWRWSRASIASVRRFRWRRCGGRARWCSTSRTTSSTRRRSTPICSCGDGAAPERRAPRLLDAVSPRLEARPFRTAVIRALRVDLVVAHVAMRPRGIEAGLLDGPRVTLVAIRRLAFLALAVLRIHEDLVAARALRAHFAFSGRRLRHHVFATLRAPHVIG